MEKMAGPKIGQEGVQQKEMSAPDRNGEEVVQLVA
jgi:hypothetical protein